MVVEGRPNCSERRGDTIEQAAESQIPAQKARPQRLKPHSRQCIYRSAEALRHPKSKSGARPILSAAWFGGALPKTGS